MSCRNILVLLAGLLLPASLAAQARPTATRDITFQAGFAVTAASPDYGDGYIEGIGIFGDVNFGPHFGIDVQFHDDALFTPHDIGESSAIASIRYRKVYHRLQPYIRAGGGLGTFTFQGTGGTSTHYGVLAGGAGLDFRLKEHVNIRAFDFEYQHWGNYPPNGLTPYVVSIGAAYVF